MSMRSAIETILVGICLTAIAASGKAIIDVAVLKENKQNVKENIAEIKKDIREIKNFIIKP